MEIKRNILGEKIGTISGEITIRLTDAEIEEIYRDRQKQYHIEDITARIEEAIDDADDESQVYIGNTCMTADQWRNLDEKTLSDLADTFDKAINNNDSWMDSYWATIDYVLEDEFTVTTNEED